MLHEHREGMSNSSMWYKCFTDTERVSQTGGRPADALWAQKRIRPNCVISYRKDGNIFFIDMFLSTAYRVI